MGHGMEKLASGSAATNIFNPDVLFFTDADASCATIEIGERWVGREGELLKVARALGRNRCVTRWNSL